MSTLTPEEQLEIIRKKVLDAEERIKKAKEDLRKLLSQQNSFSLTCRLPNEVLGLIFVSCVMDALIGKPFTVTSRVHLKRYSTRFSWIWVTHVCRHWREVALSSPTMWSTPIFDKPSLAREMLRRAQDAPLRIHIRAQDTPRWIYGQGHCPDQEALLREVVQDMTHVTELRINAGLSRHLLFQIARPAPSLRSLEMVRLSNDDEVRLPVNFLAGAVPCLRELKLQFYHLHWHKLDLSNIRSLTLIGSRSFTEQALFKGLLKSLQTMQNLYHLELDSHRPESSLDVVTLDTTISLSKLETVIIYATLSACVSILNCITIPPKATVKVSAFLPSSGSSWMTSPNIIPLLIEHIKGYEVKAISLETGTFYFRLKIFDQDLPHTYHPSDANPHLHIEFLRAYTADARCLVKQSLEVLPLFHVPVLHLAVHDVLFVDDYLDHFSELTCLHTISIEGDCAHTLLEALGWNTDPSVMNPPNYALAVGSDSDSQNLPKNVGQAAEGLSKFPQNACSRKHPKLHQIRRFLGIKSENFRQSEPRGVPDSNRPQREARVAFDGRCQAAPNLDR